MRFVQVLPSLGIAAVIALAGLAVAPVPALATDPTPAPVPAPESPSPSTAPSVEPTPSPAPSATLAPSPTPASTPTPVPSTAPTASPAPASPAPVASTTPLAAAVVTVSRAERLRLAYVRAARIAVAQRFDRYVRGGIGPNRFDCSGLVRYAYRKAGISARLGGGHSARAMLAWARRNDRTTRSNPKVGDVVIWGNGSHAGIYIGRGKVISALNPRQGIRITRLHALTARFTTFIRTQP